MDLRLGSDHKEVVSNSISFKNTVKLQRFTGLNKLCNKVAGQCPFVSSKPPESDNIASEGTMVKKYGSKVPFV